MAIIQEKTKKTKVGRPLSASECCDPALADKWRQQILREIGRKVMEIQNEGLGEHRLGDLNDEINKLILEKSNWEKRILELAESRLGDLNDEIKKLTLEKSHWETRILELNNTEQSAKVTDLDWNIVDVPSPSGTGPVYRYFGAAKKLLERPAEEAIGAAAVLDLEFMEEITQETRKAFKSG